MGGGGLGSAELGREGVYGKVGQTRQTAASTRKHGQCTVHLDQRRTAIV